MKNKKLLDKRVDLYICLVGGLLYLSQIIIVSVLRIGLSEGWWFYPNILIVSTLSLTGAIIGLKDNKFSPLLCVIAGITGFISLLMMGSFIFYFFPLYIIGALFSFFGGIVAYFNLGRY